MPTFPPRPALPIAALATCLTALASSLGAQTPTTQSSIPLTTGSSSSKRLNTSDEARATTIEQPVDRVWAAIKQAYADLKLPTTTLVDAEHRVGYAAQRLRGKLAGDRLGKLVDCGRSLDGRDAADSYEVTLDLETVVTPAPNASTPNASTVYTAVSGSANPVFTSGDPVRCVSTGRLEDRIAAAANSHLVKP